MLSLLEHSDVSAQAQNLGGELGYCGQAPRALVLECPLQHVNGLDRWTSTRGLLQAPHDVPLELLHPLEGRALESPHLAQEHVVPLRPLHYRPIATALAIRRRTRRRRRPSSDSDSGPPLPLPPTPPPPPPTPPRLFPSASSSSTSSMSCDRLHCRLIALVALLPQQLAYATDVVQLRSIHQVPLQLGLSGGVTISIKCIRIRSGVQ
mmetsp:Transcript_130398/g.417173  ORF Transcript_130398/g.417173 Transcript_130398/m.417173 type:complete len:207 (+) Transcript_130398:1322-1942(+)